MLFLFGVMMGIVVGFIISEALHGLADGEEDRRKRS